MASPQDISQGDLMRHFRTHRFSRFAATLLICGLLWYGFERVGLADNLTASGAAPSVFF